MSQVAHLRSLIAPHVSEKSNDIAEKRRQFTFKVSGRATKQSVKLAIEDVFGVTVTGVSILNVRGKTKSFKGKTGKRNDWKKAYVTIAKGQDIQFLEMTPEKG